MYNSIAVTAGVAFELDFANTAASVMSTICCGDLNVINPTEPPATVNILPFALYWTTFEIKLPLPKQFFL